MSEYAKLDAVLLPEAQIDEWFIVDEVLEDGSLKVYTIIDADEVEGHRPWKK